MNSNEWNIFVRQQYFVLDWGKPSQQYNMVLRDCHINCKNVKKKCANLRETTDNHTSKHGVGVGVVNCYVLAEVRTR